MFKNLENTPRVEKNHRDKEKATAIKNGGQILMSDRSLPGWASAMSFIFTSISSICWLGLIMIGLFFFEFVVAPKNPAMSVALFFIALIPIVAALFFDFAKVRALAGFRIARVRGSITVRACFCVWLALALTLVHPALSLGILVGAVATFLLKKLDRYLLASDPLWDFNAAEAASILAGRDNAGLRLAHKSNSASNESSLADAMQMVALGLTGVVTLAVASSLAAQGVLTVGAIFVSVMISIWAGASINKYISLISVPDPLIQSALAVSRLPMDKNKKATKGLVVYKLSVTSPTTGPILRTINLKIAPGKIVGVIGETGAGKSMLLKALSDPYDLAGLYVGGNAQFNRVLLWRSGAVESHLPAVLVQARPHLIPDTGLNNLTCFRPSVSRERAKRILEDIVFCDNTVERILDAPDATRLASGEQKALGLARAFLLNPGLYMFDRPEADANDAMLTAIAQKLTAERRAGSTILLVSDHRLLRECCDDLIVMSRGMVIDIGPRKEVSRRLSTGWSRISVERSLESEDTLHNWLHSHFRRSGDEDNRRTVCLTAGELLAFSCASETSDNDERIVFDFKHQNGFCRLHMTDNGHAIGSTELALARKSAQDTKKRGSGEIPLAEIMRASVSFEQEMDEGSRVLKLHIETYDPRKVSIDERSESHELHI